MIAITHSPYFVNLGLFKGDNKLINIQMIDGVSKTYPEADYPLRSIRLKPHTFKPEIFFANCNIFVEGASDKAVIAAISDSLDDIFAKYSIQIIDVDGKDLLALMLWSTRIIVLKKTMSE